MAGQTPRDSGGAVLHRDGAWQFANRDNDYLPFAGIAAALAVRQRGLRLPLFLLGGHGARGGRVDPRRLHSLAWYFAALPKVKDRWTRREAWWGRAAKVDRMAPVLIGCKGITDQRRRPHWRPHVPFVD